MPHRSRIVPPSSTSPAPRTSVIAAGLSMALALSTAPRDASAQIELRLQLQDPFTVVDQLAPPINREQLRKIAVESEVMTLVSRLDSEEYAEREAATELLRANEDWRMQMYALLSGESLTVEQRCRVLQIVRDQLVNIPRGALGIEMAPIMAGLGGPMEIRIVDLIPGLPAEHVLQVGDRITEIDDQPLFVQEDLQSRVQTKRPGDTVKVTVKRAKQDDNGRVIKDANEEPVTEVLHLEIALGSAEVLDRQQRNLRVMSNRVQNARRIEAESITYAFAPVPLQVHVEGGMRQASQSDPIDQHPAIINLMVQQEMINDRNPDQVRMMREMWRRQLADLIDLSNHPALDQDERARMREVAARFMELMNAGM